MGYLAVGTAEGLRSIVGVTADTTPHMPGTVSNSDLDPFMQLELECQAPANEPTLA